MSLWNSLNSVTQSLKDASITQLNASIEEARSRIDKALEIDGAGRIIEESSEETGENVKTIESSTDLASDVLGSLNSSYHEGVNDERLKSSDESKTRKTVRNSDGTYTRKNSSKSSKSIFSGNSILSGLSGYTGLTSGYDSQLGDSENVQTKSGNITSDQVVKILSEEAESGDKHFPVLENDELQGAFLSSLNSGQNSKNSQNSQNSSKSSPTSQKSRFRSIDNDHLSSTISSHNQNNQHSHRTISSENAPIFAEERKIIVEKLRQQDELNDDLLEESKGGENEEDSRETVTSHQELKITNSDKDDHEKSETFEEKSPDFVALSRQTSKLDSDMVILESAGPFQDQSIISLADSELQNDENVENVMNSTILKPEFQQNGEIDAPKVRNDEIEVNTDELESKFEIKDPKLDISDTSTPKFQGPSDSQISEAKYDLAASQNALTISQQALSASRDALLKIKLEHDALTQNSQNSANLQLSESTLLSSAEHETLKTELLTLKKQFTEKSTELMIRESQLKKLANSNAGLQETADNVLNEKSLLHDDNVKLLASLKREQERGSQVETLSKLLQKKEESIQGLLQEGEQLSKQQMHHQQANKKLRAKNKEQEIEIQNLGASSATVGNEAAKLREELKEITEREMREREQGRRMNSTVDQQSNEIQTLQFRLNEALEKQRSLQSTLDSAYKEMGDLHKNNAELQSGNSEDLVKMREEEAASRQATIVRMKSDFEKEREMVKIQLEDAQTAIQREQSTVQRRENSLKNQITELQERLQEGEKRQSELSAAVTASTRPLLRQIEQLQVSLTQQQTTSDTVERNLTSRLKEVQGDVAAQKERQRQAVDAAMDAHAKCTAMEASQMLVKQEKLRLETELDDIKTKYESVRSCESKKSIELEKVQFTMQKERDDQGNQVLILQRQLDGEREKLGTALDNLKEKERQWALLRRDDRPDDREMNGNGNGFEMKFEDEDEDTIGPAAGDTESVISEFSGIDGHLTPTSRQGSTSNADLMDHVVSKTTAYDRVQKGSGRDSSPNSQYRRDRNNRDEESTSPSQNTKSNSSSAVLNNAVIATNVFESMQAQLKTREGELNQLIQQVNALKRSRNNMAEEIVRLSNQNEDMEKYEKECDSLRGQINEINQRHNLTLTLLGEKSEECEELKLDLQDVKQMFRQQTEELLLKVAN